MIISDSHQFVLVAIPKTGSSSVHIVFADYNFPEPFIYHAPLSRILKFRPQCKDYIKCSFVRHPLDRLVSAYFDFFSRGYNYSKEVCVQEPLMSEFLSFEDFCFNIENSVWRDDVFFMPQIDFLSINGILNVDFVGRFENLQKDFNKMCLLIGVEPVILPHVRITEHDHYMKYYNRKTIELMKKRYKQDFEVFQYE